MNRKRLFYILLFVFIFIVTFCYSMFFSISTSDEIWSYSFCYNIANGFIPYKDFNMIITPLFSILGSFFIKIFGSYLFSIHIYGALWVSIIMCLMFDRIKFKSFIVYVYFLVFYIPSYNFLVLFWFLCILCCNDKKHDNDIMIGLLVSMAFLTKQTVGIVCLIPFIFYSKNKIKSMIVVLIPIILFFIYLIYFGAFYQFIDYCFLGMLDFSKNNGSNSFLIIELLILLYLVFSLVKSKFGDKKCFYVLMFQIIAFPIVDLPHLFIAFVPVVYYLCTKCNFGLKRHNRLLFYISCFGIFYFFFGFNYSICIQNNRDNFFYLRNVYIDRIDLDKQVQIIKSYNDYDYKFYILDTACLLKLYMKDTVTKYDILNNGNFGYKGAKGYIKEISNMCRNNRCVFFLPYWYYDKVEGQLNKELIDYVRIDYKFRKHYKYFDVYTN